MENNFDKSVLYGTTMILMHQFKGKHKSQLAWTVLYLIKKIA
jgi:hypothetical protein